MTDTTPAVRIVPVEPIQRLILAADSYGVRYLDSDDMSDEAQELQDATEAMKEALAAAPVAPAGEDEQLDRLFYGGGEYVRADEAVRKITELNAEIAALRARSEPEAVAEKRQCDVCGHKGSSADAHPELDYCTACGGNSPANGPDQCRHCGTPNCMVMACPKCEGRFSLSDEPEAGAVEIGEKARAILNSFHPEWSKHHGGEEALGWLLDHVAHPAPSDSSATERVRAGDLLWYDMGEGVRVRCTYRGDCEGWPLVTFDADGGSDAPQPVRPSRLSPRAALGEA